MSFQAMTWATAQTCGGATTKLVLLMLANHANNHTGQCNPRHKMLATECEIRVETLKEHLKRLSDAGLIEILPQFADGVQLPNQYRLLLQGGGGEFRPGGGGEFRPGGGGEFRPGGGGEFRPGGGGEFRPTNNQELNQEDNQGASRGMALRFWLESLKASGAEAIPAEDPVFDYAAKAGIPDAFLALAWAVFKADHTEGAGANRVQKDWRRAFRGCVEKNHLKLWYINSAGEYALTTSGAQASRVHEAAQ